MEALKLTPLCERLQSKRFYGIAWKTESQYQATWMTGRRYWMIREQFAIFCYRYFYHYY
jgi:hypothetical protein